MSQWGLSDADIMKVDWAGLDPLAHDRKYVQATLRHVYEEGEKLCPHDTRIIYTSQAKRRECSRCWAELKEAGL